MRSDASPDWTLTWHSEDQAIDYEPLSDCENDFHNIPNLIFTVPFLSNSSEALLRAFSNRFCQVALHFPEIKGEIKIGLTNSYRGLAITEFHEKKVVRKLSFPSLDKKGLPTKYVIGHELTHIAQIEKEDQPGTERATDIFTLARLPPQMLDFPPIYLRIPKWIRQNWSNQVLQPFFSNLAHELAVDSLQTRGENRRYILEWELRFKERTARVQ